MVFLQFAHFLVQRCIQDLLTTQIDMIEVLGKALTAKSLTVSKGSIIYVCQDLDSKCKLHKMFQHTPTIRWLLLTNCCIQGLKMA